MKKRCFSSMGEMVLDRWQLTLKDIFRTVIALNVVAALMYFINLLLGSNYLYIVGKPPGTTFF